MSRALVLAGLFAVLTLNPALAQQAPPVDPVETAPFRIGVLGVAPRISVTNVGVDTNVFNSPVNPQSAFTTTTSPGLGLWLRTGRGLLSLEGRLDFVYYAKYTEQGSVNSAAEGNYQYRFNRLRPWASFRVLDTRQRPGFEIDLRAKRFEDDLKAGVDFRLASKSFLIVGYGAQSTVYDDGQVYAGQPLDEALNRKSDTVSLSFRQALTPLTTVTLVASRQEERFEFTTARNSNSGHYTLGFDLGQFALIRGRAVVGFRSLAAAEGGTQPSFRGLTADIGVSYTAPSQTRFNLTANRDIQYSYDVANPYYLQTGYLVTITQRIVGRWDFQATGGRNVLAYKGTPLPNGEERRDYVDHVGGGIGYQLRADVHAGFNVFQEHRQSPIPTNNYRGMMAGLSVSYGY